MGAADPVVRPYARSDFGSCLALFDGNVPEYFAAGERAEFVAFLKEGPARAYLVLERDGAVLAAGGVSGGPSGWVTLDWGMVARSCQRAGLGRRLLAARLALARGMPGVCGVRLETSQKTRAFYEAFGFRVTAVVPEGFGPGLDSVSMVLTFAQD
jgi:GNAT superfamily N-acetyltransferase